MKAASYFISDNSFASIHSINCNNERFLQQVRLLRPLVAGSIVKHFVHVQYCYGNINIIIFYREHFNIMLLVANLAKYKMMHKTYLSTQQELNNE